MAETSQAVPAERVTSISQHDKTFTPTHVRVRRGERLWFLNNDTRTHNIRVFDDKLDFDSGAQEPGETVEIAFPKAGSYLVFCGIHPEDGADRRCRPLAAPNSLLSVVISRLSRECRTLVPMSPRSVLTGRRGEAPPNEINARGHTE